MDPLHPVNQLESERSNHFTYVMFEDSVARQHTQFVLFRVLRESLFDQCIL